MLNKKIWILAVILLTLLVVSAVSAADSDNSAGVSEDNSTVLVEEIGTFSDLENEIGNVDEGGTLSLVRDYQSTRFSDGISVSKSITIDGQGHTLDGNGLSRIFYVSADNVILKNINFVNGKSDDYGGAIYFNSNTNATIISSNFTDCFSQFGGAVNFGSDSNSNIMDSSFLNCSGQFGGAIFFNINSKSTITDSYFDSNCADVLGGSILGEGCGYISIINTKFTGSLAKYESGGAITFLNTNFNGQYLVIEDCCSEFGGAITLLSSKSNITHSRFIRNTATYDGGAVFAVYGSVYLSDNLFSDNSANRGGGLYLSKTANDLIDNQFINNTASNGGAVYCVTGNDGIIEGNVYIANTGSPEADYYSTLNNNLTITDDDYYQFTYQNIDYTVLPMYYSLLDDDLLTPVKNQGVEGNCWAFAAMATLESCILKASNLTFDLSEANLKNLMAYYSDYGYDAAVNGGGHSEMVYGYLASWLGPIFEADDKYYTNDFLSPLLSSILHVQNIVFLKRQDFTDNDAIKNAILNYGAVATGMYYDDAYLKNSLSYYYSGSLASNHAACIVGWDDAYSRYNFRDIPQADGAWIVRNSWGPDWGDNGYFYVSYYDTVFAQVNESDSYTFILNDTVKLDRVYQWEIEKTSYLNTNEKYAVYKNVFKAQGNEYLAAVSTYFLDECEYNINIYLNGVLVCEKSGKTDEGYYTINLDDLIYLNKDDTVEVVFNCTNFKDGSVKIPIADKSFCTNLFTGEGISYYWINNKWVDSSSDDYVTCIKMFTTFSAESKLNPYFQIISEGDSYDNTNTVTFIMPGDAEGVISIKINENEYVLDVSKERSIKFHNLDENNNTLIVTYSGDEKYLEKSLVYVVDTVLRPGTFNDLSDKINGLKDGDVLTLTKDYVSTATGAIQISKSITIDGRGHTINANSMMNVFNVRADNVILKNINFVWGNSTYGGAISVEGANCQVIDCNFTDNCAKYGGAIYWSGANGLLANCYFKNNHASDLGGAVYWSGDEGVLTNSLFNDSSAMYGGAVGWTGAGGVLVSSSFNDNSAQAGGALYWSADECILANCSFADNSASQNTGGAIYMDCRSCEISNSLFSNNYAQCAGAVYISGESAVFSDTIFINNSVHSSYEGGAVYWSVNEGILNNCSFVNNTAYAGSAISVYGSGTLLNDCSFIDNSAAGAGAAIYLHASNCEVNNSYFANNRASVLAGAIFMPSDNNHISNCCFADNSAPDGGAIVINGENNLIDDSSFADNIASQYGGAVLVQGNKDILDNCSFRDNQALMYGGAVFWNGGDGIMSDCILADNNNINQIYWANKETGTITGCRFINNTDCVINNGAKFIKRYVTMTVSDYIFDYKNPSVITLQLENGLDDFPVDIVVTFKFTKGNDIKIFTIKSNNNMASLYEELKELNVGNWSVSAIFDGDDNYYPTGTAFTVTVNPIKTSLSISCGEATLAKTTLKATIANDYNLIINEGHVTFYDDGINIGTSDVKNNVASLSYAPATAGEHLITAVYSADNYLTSTGSVKIQISSQGSPTNGKIVPINLNAEYRSGEFTFKLTDTNTNKALSDKKLKYTIITESINSTGTITTDENGIASIDNRYLTIKIIEGGTIEYIPIPVGKQLFTLESGDESVICEKIQDYFTVTAFKENTQITSSAISTVYNGDKYLIATLRDAQGNPLHGLILSINLNGVKMLTTDANGQVKLTTNGLSPKTYTATITFAGDNNYGGSSATVKVIVTKATPKLTASAKTFKFSIKTKKYTVTLKDNKNKVMKSTYVTLKVNKKTYKVKTNTKGQATFKITNLNKKGTFVAEVKYAGNSNYKAKTVKPKISVK